IALPAALFDVVQLLAPQIRLAPEVADAFADQRAAGLLEDRVVPLADVRDVLRRGESAVGELHQAALALADHAAQASDFIETGEAARDRLAVFAIVTLVGIGRKAEGARRH